MQLADDALVLGVVGRSVRCRQLFGSIVALDAARGVHDFPNESDLNIAAVRIGICSENSRERNRTGEGVRGIAKRFGVDPSTVQRISRPFAVAAAPGREHRRNQTVHLGLMRPPTRAISKPCPRTDIRRPRRTIRAECNNPTNAQTIPGQ